MKGIEARLVFGFALLLLLAGLAIIIALGMVEEKSSYGLTPLLVSLGSLGGAWAQWAFRTEDRPKDKSDVDQTKAE